MVDLADARRSLVVGTPHGRRRELRGRSAVPGDSLREIAALILGGRMGGQS